MTNSAHALTPAFQAAQHSVLAVELWDPLEEDLPEVFAEAFLVGWAPHGRQHATNAAGRIITPVIAKLRQ